MLALANLKVCRIDTRNKERFLDHRKKGPFAGEIIEFLAPSCAGKSHTIEHLRTHLGTRWISSKELPQQIYENPFDLASEETKTFYRLIIAEKVKNFLSSNMTQLKYNNKLIALEFHLSNARYNCALDVGLNVGVVSDEGLSSCFWREILALDDEAQKLINIIFHRRHVVFYQVPEEIFMDRIRRRQQQNPAYHSNYPGYSENDIKYHIASTYERMEGLAEKLGSSVLLIEDDGSGNTDANCEKIKDFVESRIAQRG